METPTDTRNHLRALVIRLRDFNRAQLQPLGPCVFVNDAQREHADYEAYASAVALLQVLATNALDLLPEKDRTRLLQDLDENAKVLRSLQVSA